MPSAARPGSPPPIADSNQRSRRARQTRRRWTPCIVRWCWSFTHLAVDKIAVLIFRVAGVAGAPRLSRGAVGAVIALETVEAPPSGIGIPPAVFVHHFHA